VGQHAEMMVKGRYPHPCNLSQIIYAYRLRVVVPDPGDRSRRSMTLISLVAIALRRAPSGPETNCLRKDPALNLGANSDAFG